MASVADAAKQMFIKYYDHVMPLLRTLLSGSQDRGAALLRAKALECISLVGMAVGRDRFRQDAHAVMELIRVMQVRHGALLGAVRTASRQGCMTGLRLALCAALKPGSSFMLSLLCLASSAWHRSRGQAASLDCHACMLRPCCAPCSQGVNGAAVPSSACANHAGFMCHGCTCAAYSLV